MEKLTHLSIRAVRATRSNRVTLVGVRIPGHLTPAQKERLGFALAQRFRRKPAEISIAHDCDSAECATCAWMKFLPIKPSELIRLEQRFAAVVDEVGVAESTSLEIPTFPHS